MMEEPLVVLTNRIVTALNSGLTTAMMKIIY